MPPSTHLYVLEDGGEWPRWLDQAEGAEGPLLIRQEEAESPAQFGSRVAREVSAMKTPVDHAVIACNERHDDAAVSGRREAGTAVLSYMAKSGKGNLLFTESRRQSGGSRSALSALAQELGNAWEGSDLSVSVRFGQPSRPPQESIPPPSIRSA